MTKENRDKWLDDLIDADLASESYTAKPLTEEIRDITDETDNTDITEETPALPEKTVIIPTIKKHSDIELPSDSDAPVIDSFFVPKTGIIFDYDAEIVIEPRVSTIPSILDIDVTGNDPDVNYTAIRNLKQYRQYAEERLREGKDFERFSTYLEQRQ